MATVVLESFLGSQYDDSPTSYEFPTRYLPLFEPLSRGEHIDALIYEPRGAGIGRMAYVALASISSGPIPSGRVSRSGAPLWIVQYDGPAQPFDQTVPREILGDPVEAWLRDRDRGRSRSVATVGRAVRAISDEDFQRILELGNGSLLDVEYPVNTDHLEATAFVRERTEVLVSMFRRDNRFRQDVLAAYGFRCAVSGFELGPISTTKPNGVLDAAHIRPVNRNGPDRVSNGIPLTPTLHRLFDVGLFTLRYHADRPEVRVSTLLTEKMIVVPDRNFRLPLADGIQLLVPDDRASWPDPDQLRYHEREVFQV